MGSRVGGKGKRFSRFCEICGRPIIRHYDDLKNKTAIECLEQNRCKDHLGVPVP